MSSFSIPREKLLDAAFEAGLDEDFLVWEYSGRYMYGKSCFGIVGNVLDYTMFLLHLSQYEDGAGFDWAIELALRVNTDNMAQDTIFYFPGVDVLDDEDGKDEPLSLQKT